MSNGEFFFFLKIILREIISQKERKSIIYIKIGEV